MEKEIIERIKGHREARRISVSRFAQMLGFESPTGYVKIEKGETDLKVKHLEKVSEVLGIPVGELMGLEADAGGDGPARQVRELELSQALLLEYAKGLLLELAGATCQRQGTQLAAALADPPAAEAAWREFFGHEGVSKLFRAKLIQDRQLLSLWERYGEG